MFKENTLYKSNYTLNDFLLPPLMEQWINDNLLANAEIPNLPNADTRLANANLPIRFKSLFMVGKSRIGKTQLARCIGPHWYNITMFYLDGYNNECKYAVFDDIDITRNNFNLFKPFIGCQETINCTDKYRHKVQIKWNKPSIFLMNNEEFDEMMINISRGQKEYVKENSVILLLYKLIKD